MSGKKYVLFFALFLLSLGGPKGSLALTQGGILTEGESSSEVSPTLLSQPVTSPGPKEQPELPQPEDPNPSAPQEPPPSQVPPPIMGCPGKLDENFEVEAVKFHFYTARQKGAGTQQPVWVKILDDAGAAQDEVIIQNWNDSPLSSTEPGGMYHALKEYKDDHFTSNQFKKFEIGLVAPEQFVKNDVWFLGGLVVEVLKKGCNSQDPKQWSNLYFNPVVRTWIGVTFPIIVTPDDAVAIFEIHVGTKDDAGSDGDFYVQTPINWVKLDYEDTDDTEAGRTYYYGGSSFAEAKNWAEFGGKFSEISSMGGGVPSVLFISKTRDGAYFDLVRAYLIQPKFHEDSLNPFFGYGAWLDHFWSDNYGWDWSPLLIPLDWDWLITDQAPHEIPNFGQALVQTTALDFLYWFNFYDNPGWTP